jgi:tRNA dimethylallyltransferase
MAARLTLSLIVIVGETASGKSALAMDVARLHDGEIICADSRTVYKGMDIGTSKPSKADQQLIKHHLLDVRTPDQRFTAAEFKLAANRAISDIRRRNKLPILVGGTGLYIDAVIFDYSFRMKYDNQIRQSLESKATSELSRLVYDAELTTDLRTTNRRQLIRMLEAGVSTEEDRTSMLNNVVLIGTKITRSELRKRINQRVEQMFRAGLRKEVDRLVRQYGWGHESLTGIGYREFEAYYLGELSMEGVKRLIVQHTLQYAKRQRTWFKRNPKINWFEDFQSALDYINSQLITK